LLVDDQKSTRFMVGTLCHTLGTLQVVGEAENGQQAVELADSLLPDLILMDAQMPVLDGLEATRQISQRHPKISIIILSAHSEHSVVREALRAGARGYIQKDELTENRLTHAIKVVEAGSLFFDVRTGTGLLQSIYSE
jgi:DNA-binding NarL/FixJ family response regulator